MADYTLSELMVVAAAREIHDGDVVFVGMRLPLIAYVVAKNTHAPNAIGVFENGVLRRTPASKLIMTMSDGPNITGALACMTMLECMALLQQGRVSLGFLGAAEVDKHGNLNSTEVESGSGADKKYVRLPGSGGACDIATLAHRFVALMAHEKERLPERVNYITSPGNGPWREHPRLKQGGPSAVITTKAVLRFDDSGEAYLDSTHPGVAVNDVLANTGWPLRTLKKTRETKPPNARELKVIRDYDPNHFWTK
ncbi:MAG: CoA-transferase [Acidobacteria bacterium]|nr:CoA-transferase [Acidobacteriota bacterium]